MASNSSTISDIATVVAATSIVHLEVSTSALAPALPLGGLGFVPNVVVGGCLGHYRSFGRNRYYANCDSYEP
jgi:hypothetical protein